MVGRLLWNRVGRGRCVPVGTTVGAVVKDKVVDGVAGSTVPGHGCVSKQGELRWDRGIVVLIVMVGLEMDEVLDKVGVGKEVRLELGKLENGFRVCSLAPLESVPTGFVEVGRGEGK